MAELSVEDARSLAQRLMQEGRTVDAENLLRGSIARSPQDAELRHLLGIIYAQTGLLADSESLIRSAIALAPHTAAYHANLGNVLQEMGRVDDAISAYLAALKIDPALAAVRSNLANALQRYGRFAEAVEHYRAALRITPDQAVIHVNLGNALRAMGQHYEAAESYQRAANLEPRYLDANLGLALSQLASEQFGGAFETCRRALAIDSNSQPARQMLGTALRALARPGDAIISLREVIRREPMRWEAWHELAGALRESGDVGGSVEAYRRVIELEPNYAGAHYGLAWSLLQQGDYAAGFAEYEWRERLESAPKRTSSFPRWDGTPDKNHRVVLVAEQGLGDCIMAYRYLPVVRERVGEVILQCPAALQKLFAEQPGAARVVGDVESANATTYCSMMSLPYLFETRIETIPATMPYLVADDPRRAAWSHRVKGGREKRGQESFSSRERNSRLKKTPDPLNPSVLNVGIAWIGNKTPLHRSIPPEGLKPLGALTGVRFHSLQGGATARNINAACTALPIVDWSAELVDFAEVAALIANLDCVVTIDTAVAHLAGAMGKRTLVLLNYAPDWRWMNDRTDSPWYPTVRLFRQRGPLDWQPVLADVVAELRK